MTTLAAVAAHARVGIGTVSRVVNDRPNVSPEMRARVHASMTALDYQPIPSRARQQERRPGYVGVIVTNFAEPSALARCRGVVDQLRPHGFDVVLYDVDSPADARRRVMEVPQHATLDGLIVMSVPLSRADGERLAAAPFPVVLVDTAVAGLPSVNVDDRAGGAAATAHLVELGHRRIAFLGEPSNHVFGFVASVRREEGWERALRCRGIEPAPELVRHGEHRRDVAASLAHDLLTSHDPPTAVVAASDVLALGVLDAARALGRCVPGDLSVVGYDDIDLAAAHGLTTVRQPLEGSGRRAADLVLEAMATPGTIPIVADELPTELVVRTTTGPHR